MKWYAKVYVFFGVLMLIGAYLNLLWIYYNATLSGLQTGQYAVTLYTNIYGENYLEFALFLAGLPAALYIWAITVKWASRRPPPNMGIPSPKNQLRKNQSNCDRESQVEISSQTPLTSLPDER